MKYRELMNILNNMEVDEEAEVLDYDDAEITSVSVRICIDSFGRQQYSVILDTTT